MLTVTYTVKSDHPMGGRDVKEYTWKRGERPSEILDDASLEVVSVYADGAERDYIIEDFPNLPWRKQMSDIKSIVWRGEFARFIFDNL